MTREDIEYLLSEEGRRTTVENLGRDPVQVALDKRLSRPALIASQVKYLGRAQRKLPSYYAARCIIPPLAFEQSSSEATAALKEYSGGLCIDLTCGLGVDTLHFSHSFREVLSVEKDETLTQIARANFNLLGADNITVVNSSAEDFITPFAAEGRRADMIYADPDRRPGDGGRKIRLEDCTPDMVALMPLLRTIAGRVAVKCSPLFDVDEAFRLFGPACRVEVISAGGECKEVIIETGDEVCSGEICATVAGKGKFRFPANSFAVGEPEAASTPNAAGSYPSTFAPPYELMIIPDVALRKSRLTARYFAATLPEAFVTPGDGYVFMQKNDLPRHNIATGAIPGKVFEIDRIAAYRPKELKRELASRGIKRADIYLHNFPAAAAKICRELGIREGGGDKLAFTSIAGSLWTVFIKEVSL